MATKEEMQVAALIAKAVYQILHDLGTDGAQCEVLYVGLQRYGMRLEQFWTIIDALKKVGAVREEQHVLFANTDVGMSLGLL